MFENIKENWFRYTLAIFLVICLLSYWKSRTYPPTLKMQIIQKQQELELKQLNKKLAEFDKDNDLVNQNGEAAKDSK